jgi:hypothetical protein
VRAFTRNIFRYNATAEPGDWECILIPFTYDKPVLKPRCEPQHALDQRFSKKMYSFWIHEKGFSLVLWAFKYDFSKIFNQLESVNDKVFKYKVYSRYAEQNRFYTETLYSNTTGVVYSVFTNERI